MDKEKFGAYLAELRTQRGLTQAQLGGVLHVTDKAISRWERGIGFPDITTVEPLAEALGVSVAELMKSQRVPVDCMEEPTEDAVKNTLSLAKLQKKKTRAKWIAAFMGYIAVKGCIGVFTDSDPAHYNNLPMAVVCALLALYLGVTAVVAIRAFRPSGWTGARPHGSGYDSFAKGKQNGQHTGQN